MNKPANIDEYISDFPEEIRERLQQIRATVKAVIPDAEEAIKYGMPTFVRNGNLVHFAAFKNHIGFYPAPADPADFEIDLTSWKTGRGSIQFPHNQELPLHIVTAITNWRVRNGVAS